MKRGFFLFFILIWSLPLLAAPQYRGCYDGDTCYFDLPEGANLPVRLLGVDTPERKGRCPEEKVLALAAKGFSEGALRSARQIELRRAGKDKYGRILARVLLNGQDLADLLIQAKLGRPYKGGKRLSWCGP